LADEAEVRVLDGRPSRSRPTWLEQPPDRRLALEAGLAAAKPRLLMPGGARDLAALFCAVMTRPRWPP